MKGALNGKKIVGAEVIEGTMRHPTEVLIHLEDGSSERIVEDFSQADPFGRGYETLAAKGRLMADELNRIGFANRKWSSSEAQSLMWMNSLYKHGEPLATPERIFSRQTSHFHAGVHDLGPAFEGIYPALNSLDGGTRDAITSYIASESAHNVADLFRSTSLRIADVRPVRAVVNGVPVQHIVVQAVGSPEIRNLYGAALAHHLGLPEVRQVTYDVGDRLAAVLMGADGKPLVDDVVRAFAAAHPSLVPTLVEGRGGHVIGDLTPAAYNKLERAFDEWADARGLQAEIGHVRQTSRNIPKGIRSTQGGVEGGGRGVGGNSLFPIKHATLVEKAFQELAPGLLDPTQARQRVEAAVRRMRRL